MKDHLQNKINSGQMWAISGRKGSGKWELAKILIDQGSVRISMADFLKKSIAKLYEIDEIWTTDQSKKEEIWTTPLIWNKEIAKKYPSTKHKAKSKNIPPSAKASKYSL